VATEPSRVDGSASAIYRLRNCLDGSSILQLRNRHDSRVRADAVDAEKVTLNKISWFVPYADADKFSFLFYKSTESSLSLLHTE